MNICQNVGPNELCIVFILSFFFSVSVSLSLFTGKRKKKRGGGGERRARTTKGEYYII